MVIGTLDEHQGFVGTACIIIGKFNAWHQKETSHSHDEHRGSHTFKVEVFLTLPLYVHYPAGGRIVTGLQRR